MTPQSAGTVAAMVQKFTGLTSDSRQVAPGFLFAALPGTKTDGARFVKDAVARGAIAVLGPVEIEDAVKASGAVFLPAANPRAELARFAAAFYGAQPQTVAAVTGTKGKSSIVAFLREIWTSNGHKAASLGTLGVVGPQGEIPLSHTTPDPVEIHELLARLSKDGVDHLAIEASSHGLDQHRLDGVAIKACGFTNITRDHMDYHPTFDHYLAAKVRLFTEVVQEGGIAVVNADAEHSDKFIAAAEARKLTVMTVGAKGEAIRMLACEGVGDNQQLMLEHGGNTYDVLLPLAGAFQASNALVAAGLAIGLGEDAAKTFAALTKLRGAAGRMERVAYTANGAVVYVDYAHTPDSLEKVLEALRAHTPGRLHVVFGCGGDRDKGKRPLMGAIAAKLADDVIVTDDNPRTEDAAAIRREILAAAPGAQEYADRRVAIQTAVARLEGGDTLVIAGKGHETGQYVQGQVFAFSDKAEAVNAALMIGGYGA